MTGTSSLRDSGDLDAGSFGARLLALRLAANLSQEDLAGASGLSVHTISQLELGRRAAPQAESARLLADALGLAGEERDAFFATVRQRRYLRSRARDANAAVLPPRPAPGAASATEPENAVAPAPGVALPSRDPGRAAILGRAADIAAIESRLAAGDRLLTLIGPGGIGKTRLARAIVDRWSAANSGGVTWVDLDAVTAPDMVLPAIAYAAGVREQPSIARVADVFGAAPALLVLDNFEHVAAAAPVVAALLDGAPGLFVLVTSREAMRLGEERLVPVDPLPLPGNSAPTPELAANPAVVLFMRALHAAAPTRAAHAADLADAAAVVRLLDGLPLAIELAAAQGATLPPASIALLLETAGLSLLARGRRDVPARFHTMEAAIAWSADLLPPDAQRLFRLLGVFRGGFTAGAAIAVTAAAGAPHLIAHLPRLAESQLIQTDPASDAPRLRMLEPVRMFALDRVRAAGEEAAARSAHAAWFLRWAQEQADIVGGPDPMPALDTLDADLANIQTAIASACGSADPADVTEALRAAARLSQYWEIAGRFVEGRAALETAIAAAEALDGTAAMTRPGSIVPEALMDAIFFAGCLAYLQADASALERTAARLRPLAETDGSPEHRARVAILEILLDEARGEAPAALVARARAAHALVASGPRETSWHVSLLATANLLAENGDLADALPLFIDLADWARQRQAAIQLRTADTWLGHLLLRLGRRDEARQRLIDSLAGSGASRSIAPLAWSVLGLAAAITGPGATAGEHARAAHLLGVYDAQMIAHHLGATPRQAALALDARASIAAALGEDRLAELVAEGRDMPVQDVLAIARA